MAPRTFYRLALLLPVLIPVLSFPFAGESKVFAILVISLVFGGVAYIIFALFMFFWLKKYETASDMFLLTLKAPLIFIPIQAFTWMAYYYYDKLSNPELGGAWEALLPFAVYILIIGYAYVFVVHMAYLLFSALGWVVEKDVHSVKSLKPG